MARFPAQNAAIQPAVIQPQPDTTADTEARRGLRRETKTFPGTSHVAPANGAVAARIAGTQVSGGARITGGKG